MNKPKFKLPRGKQQRGAQVESAPKFKMSHQELFLNNLRQIQHNSPNVTLNVYLVNEIKEGTCVLLLDNHGDLKLY